MAAPNPSAVIRRQGRFEEPFVRTVLEAMWTGLESPDHDS